MHQAMLYLDTVYILCYFVVFNGFDDGKLVDEIIALDLQSQKPS